MKPNGGREILSAATATKAKNKAKNSIRKKDSKRGFTDKKIKAFATEFYDRYGKLMSRLSHE